MANLPLIVLIGDSIRMGYQDHVASQLAGRAEVWVPKENGGDSRNVFAHLDQWVFSRQPDLVHVNCGLHDLKRAFGAESAVPLAEYGRNVRQILQRLQRELDGAVVWAALAALPWPSLPSCNASWTGPSSGPLPRRWTKIGTIRIRASIAWRLM